MIEIENIIEKTVEVPVEVVVFKDRSIPTTSSPPASSKTVMGDGWAADVSGNGSPSTQAYSTAAVSRVEGYANSSSAMSAENSLRGATFVQAARTSSYGGVAHNAWGGASAVQTRMETQKVLVGYQPKYEVIGS